MVMISVVIPAYNEEKRIGKSIKKIVDFFNKKKINFEIIVANDGSTDRTKEIVSKIKNKGIKIIDNETNRGKGFSVKRGVLESNGKIILFTDADLSTPIQEYSKLKYWYDKGFDICIGSRRLKNSSVMIKQPIYRRLSGIIFGRIVQLVFGLDIKDTQCGFKLFNGKAAKKIFNEISLDGFSFDVEALYLAKKKNVKIKEVPIIWIDSAKGSKVNVVSESFRMFRDIIKIKIAHR